MLLFNFTIGSSDTNIQFKGQYLNLDPKNAFKRIHLLSKVSSFSNLLSTRFFIGFEANICNMTVIKLET